MIDRTVFDSDIKKLQNIVSHYNEDLFSNMTNNLMREIDTFEIKAVFLGHFNAGKSSLINALLDTDLLSVSQSPETSIAAELHYSDEERLFAEDFSRNIQSVPAISQATSDKYLYVRYLFPNEFLRDICDFTIVDTPGFDSYNTKHTKAVDAYVGKGAVYIFVIDAEKGGIDAETLHRLSDVYSYNKHVFLIINKCDKQTDENLLKIKENAVGTLRMHFIDCPVFCTSVVDTDVKNVLHSIIQSIDSQQIFDEYITSQITHARSHMRVVLEDLLHTSYYSSFDDDSKIHDLESSIKDLTERFEIECAEARTGISDKIDSLSSEVREALIGKADQMVSLIKNSDTEAQRAVIFEAIHPILRKAFTSIIPEQLRSIAQSLDFSYHDSAGSGTPFSKLLIDMLGTFSDSMQDDSYSAPVQQLPIPDKNSGEKISVGFLYKALTIAGAAFTSILTPITEALVIFAPEIMNFFSNLIGSVTEKQKIKTTYIEQVVPQICMKITTALEDAMIEQFDQVILKLKEEFEKNKCAMQEQVEILKEHRSSSEEAYNEMQSMLETDIAELK